MANTQNSCLLFQKSHVNYYRWGRGPRLLLCFHGYGESAESFSFLEEWLGNIFTVLAIDLPYHGQTDWKDEPLTPSTLLAIIDQIVAKEHSAPISELTGDIPDLPVVGDVFSPAVMGDIPVPPLPGDIQVPPLPGTLAPPKPGDPPFEKGWWLMGYSMGGRIALSLLEIAPDKIGRLILLAPDGLVINPWYRLATQTSAGRRLFQWTMNHPGWFFFMLRAGNKLGLVNPSVYKFVSAYVGNSDVRKSLYTRWTALRRFKPQLPPIKHIIRRRQIPIQLLYGKFDRIILAKRGEQFRKGIEPWCEITVISAGHQLLKKEPIQALLSPYIYR